MIELQTRPWRQILRCASPWDRLLMPCFLFGVPFTACYELLVIFPSYYPDHGFSITELTPVQLLHITIGILCLVNSLGNWCYLVRTNTTSAAYYPRDDVITAHLPASQLRECDRCNGGYRLVPARSHHCPVCDVCILRHDHHCWFSGCCIGAANYRFYLVMLAYTWLAGVYSSLFNLDFVLTILDYQEHGAIRIVLCLVAPHFMALAGALSPVQVAVAALTSLGTAFTMVISALLAFQVRHLMRGQTAWEWRKGYREFDQGCCGANWRQVLGKRWWLVWLSPAVKSPVALDTQLVPALSKLK